MTWFRYCTVIFFSYLLFWLVASSLSCCFAKCCGECVHLLHRISSPCNAMSWKLDTNWTLDPRGGETGLLGRLFFIWQFTRWNDKKLLAVSRCCCCWPVDDKKRQFKVKNTTTTTHPSYYSERGHRRTGHRRTGEDTHNRRCLPSFFILLSSSCRGISTLAYMIWRAVGQFDTVIRGSINVFYRSRYV